jgi:hypothetical protein
MDTARNDILVGSAFIVAGGAVFAGSMIGAAEIAQSLSQTFGAVAALGSCVPVAYLVGKGIYYAGGLKRLAESSAATGKPAPEM